MTSSTFVVLDEIKDEKKELPKPTTLDMSQVKLLENDNDSLRSPKSALDSPRNSSPRSESPRTIKRSPRLMHALQEPSPPRREVEIKDMQNHDAVVTKRKSSGSFSFKVVKASDSHITIKKPDETTTNDTAGAPFKRV